MSESKSEHIYRSRKQIITNNFLGGVAWGIGVTIGLALFFGILAFISTHIDFVPIVGEFISNVIDYILRSGNNFPR